MRWGGDEEKGGVIFKIYSGSIHLQYICIGVILGVILQQYEYALEYILEQSRCRLTAE